jgi:hypothetical protein
METVDVLERVAAFIGTAGAAFWGAWKLRGRKDAEHTPPIYRGEPDHSPRRITRKEWHDLGGKVNDAVLGVALLKAQQKESAATMLALRAELTVHAQSQQAIAKAIEHLQTQFESHVERWEDVGQRAAADREETNARLSTLDGRLVTIEGQRADIMGKLGTVEGLLRSGRDR